MDMIEIVHPTQQEMYDEAKDNVVKIRALLPYTHPATELLEHIQFYLMAFPPEEVDETMWHKRTKPEHGTKVIVQRRPPFSPMVQSAIYWRKPLTGKAGFFFAGNRLEGVTRWMGLDDLLEMPDDLQK